MFWFAECDLMVRHDTFISKKEKEKSRFWNKMDVNLETIDERPEREEQQEAAEDTFYLEDPVELKTWEGFFDTPVRSEAEGTPSVAEAKRENKRYLTRASKNKTKLFKDFTRKKGSLTKEKIEKVSRGFYNRVLLRKKVFCLTMK